MSAINLNRVVMTGNLTRDPQLRSLHSGTSVCQLRIASNTRRKVNGEWQDKPNYFDVVVWGAQGEACARCLAKGSRIAFDGRLEWREYTAQDRQKRQVVELVADSVEFLSRPGGAGAAGSADEPTGDGDGAAQVAEPEPVAQEETSAAAPRRSRLRSTAAAAA